MCEEFFFRGYLLIALERSMSGTRAVLLSSILFGLFHLVAIEQLHFERLIPSTCLGLVLGWVCLRSGSVLPGMLLHAIHNSLLLVAAYYQERLVVLGLGPRPIGERGNGVPPGKLAHHCDDRHGDRFRPGRPGDATPHRQICLKASAMAEARDGAAVFAVPAVWLARRRGLSSPAT